MSSNKKKKEIDRKIVEFTDNNTRLTGENTQLKATESAMAQYTNKPCFIQLGTPCPSFLGLATHRTIDDFIANTDRDDSLMTKTRLKPDIWIKKLTPRKNSLIFLKKKLTDDEYSKIFGIKNINWYIFDPNIWYIKTLSPKERKKYLRGNDEGMRWDPADYGAQLNTRNKALFLSYLRYKGDYTLTELQKNIIKKKLKFIDDRDRLSFIHPKMNNTGNYEPKYTETVLDTIIPSNINIYKLEKFPTNHSILRDEKANTRQQWGHNNKFDNASVYNRNDYMKGWWVLDYNIAFRGLYNTGQSIENLYKKEGDKYILTPDKCKYDKMAKNFYKLGIKDWDFLDNFDLEEENATINYKHNESTPPHSGDEPPTPDTVDRYIFKHNVYKANKDGTMFFINSSKGSGKTIYLKGEYFIILDNNMKKYVELKSQHQDYNNSEGDGELHLYRVENNYYEANGYNIKIIMRNNICHQMCHMTPGFVGVEHPHRPYYSLDMLINDTKEGKTFNEKHSGSDKFYINKHAYENDTQTDQNKYVLDLGCNKIKNLGYDKWEKRSVDPNKKLCLFVIHNLLVMATLVEHTNPGLPFVGNREGELYFRRHMYKDRSQIILEVIDILPNQHQGGGSKNIGGGNHILSEKDKTVNDKILRNEKLKKSYDHIENIINNSNNKELIVKQVLNTFKIINNNNKNTLKVLSKNIREKKDKS